MGREASGRSRRFSRNAKEKSREKGVVALGRSGDARRRSWDIYHAPAHSFDMSCVVVVEEVRNDEETEKKQDITSLRLPSQYSQTSSPPFVTLYWMLATASYEHLSEVTYCRFSPRRRGVSLTPFPFDQQHETAPPTAP
jgi:hypothetical protein